MKFNADYDRFVLTLDLMRKGMKNDVMRIVDDAVKTGGEKMDEFISTRGTSKPGRIDTENMIGSVAATEAEWTGTSVRGKFGWPKAYAEDYFFYQENGFYHVGAGRDVPPMHALLDAYVIVREQLLQDLSDMWG